MDKDTLAVYKIMFYTIGFGFLGFIVLAILHQCG